MAVENRIAGFSDHQAVISGGSVVFTRTDVDTDYFSQGENIIGVTDTSSSVNIILSSADVLIVGLPITIKDESGAANTINITITTEGSETIDGVSSIPIDADYGKLTVYSDGSNWFSI